MSEKRKVILGLGNLLQKDEGFGIHAISLFEERLTPNLKEQFELIDGGVLGLNLLPLIEETSHLLVFDAIDAGRPAGTIVEMTGAEIPLYTNVKLSEHQVSFQEILGLAKFRGSIPENLHLIGVQPADLSTGLSLSPPVENALDGVVQRAINFLQTW
jgi:hydrogenase maturation protease